MFPEEKETSCGIFSWRPKWLQKFANLKLYVLIYSTLSMIQSMGFSYANVVLTSVERRFGIKSKDIAWIYAGNEISQVIFIFGKCDVSIH